ASVTASFRNTTAESSAKIAPRVERFSALSCLPCRLLRPRASPKRLRPKRQARAELQQPRAFLHTSHRQRSDFCGSFQLPTGRVNIASTRSADKRWNSSSHQSLLKLLHTVLGRRSEINSWSRV